MASALDPLRESERLAALYAYHVLDTRPESAFDELTALASKLCQTPIALVSLVDDTRQWFKSRVGLHAKETPRELAFCSHAIEGCDTMVVQDAKADTRFHDNPLVTGEPNIRFYAGAPLTDRDGHALGTLCVIDTQPRELTADQLEDLEILSRQVMRLMELRLSNRQLAASLDRVRCISDLIPICAHCHAIRNAKDDWERLEKYFDGLSSTRFSHGICPSCLIEHYPDELGNLQKRHDAQAANDNRPD